MLILNLIFAWFEDLHEFLILVLEAGLGWETLQLGLSALDHGIDFVSEQKEGVLKPWERGVPHHEDLVLDITLGDLGGLHTALAAKLHFWRLDFFDRNIILILVVFELLSVIGVHELPFITSLRLVAHDLEQSLRVEMV